MNKISYLKSKQVFRKIGIIVSLASVSGMLISAELPFSNAPLFLQSGVQPNIEFIVDDSGSMYWAVVKSKNARTVYKTLTDSWIDEVDYHPTLTDWEEILHTCSGINTMYFDPDKIYTPWEGVNKGGVAFPNQTLKAQEFPNEVGSTTFDLAAAGGDGFPAGYFKWVDLNNNGEWDEWSDVLKKNNVPDVWVDLNGNGKFEVGESEYECPNVDHFSATELKAWFTDTSEMSVTEQKNFANWFSYYRKREYVAKRALSSIISSSTVRMGLRTLHNNSSVYTQVKDVDDISTPVDTTAKKNKETLLEQMFNVESKNGTPLRETLVKTGKYFKSAAGPILPITDGGQCQQNFAILMTDGYANGGTPSVGNADKHTTSNPYDGGLYADRNTGVSNTLADVAMYYYKNDLKTGYDDLVPTNTADNNPQQHLVTYTVAFGVEGNLDGDIKPSATDPKWLGWPTPAGNESTIDDVRHAAYNGRGLFLNAQDPDTLIKSLNDAIQDIQGRTASSSSVAVNSGSYTSLAMVFQAQFNSQTWVGRINGYPLKSNGSVDSAGNALASVVPVWTDRVIMTHNGTKGVPFRWDKGITASQKTELTDTPELLDYIRGDTSNEEVGKGYRKREIWDTEGAGSHLGDIVNSSPAYVGEPEFRYPDVNFESVSYSSYRLDPDGDGISKKVGNNTFRRLPMLYAGSNDGMLHGFKVDPDTSVTDFGKEVFAYVPRGVMKRLPDLADKNYRHAYTVDGAPSVGDAFFGGAWHTVLTSGLNAGGQGVYALDITKPQRITSEAKAEADKVVLWDFTDAEDKDLGYTYGKPAIVKANNGKWVAIFGNGYNNTASDGNVGGGTPVLYIRDLETGADLRKFDTKANVRLDSSATPTLIPNGLSAPTTLDVNGDFKADYVYAGDLEGNLWKFDISNTDPSKWKIAHGTSVKPEPLFTACSDVACTDSNRQPITVKPEVGLNKGAFGHIVYFGTGSYVYSVDSLNTQLQTLYGIWDKNLPSGFSKFNKFHLLQQEIQKEKDFPYTDPLTSKSVPSWQRLVTNYPITWHETSGVPKDNDLDLKVDAHLGWYLNLVDTDTNSLAGERGIVNPVLRGDMVIFNTVIPNKDPCSDGGDGWVMTLWASSGSRPPSDDPYIDVNNDSIIDGKDLVTFSKSATNVASAGTKILSLGECVFYTLADGSEVCLIADPGSEPKPLKVKSQHDLGRWMWQEL